MSISDMFCRVPMAVRFVITMATVAGIMRWLSLDGWTGVAVAALLGVAGRFICGHARANGGSK